MSSFLLGVFMTWNRCFGLTPGISDQIYRNRVVESTVHTTRSLEPSWFLVLRARSLYKGYKQNSVTDDLVICPRTKKTRCCFEEALFRKENHFNLPCFFWARKNDSLQKTEKSAAGEPFFPQPMHTPLPIIPLPPVCTGRTSYRPCTPLPHTPHRPLSAVNRCCLRRAWAKRLTDKFSSLSDLRRLSWPHLIWHTTAGSTEPAGRKRTYGEEEV